MSASISRRHLFGRAIGACAVAALPPVAVAAAPATIASPVVWPARCFDYVRSITFLPGETLTIEHRAGELVTTFDRIWNGTIDEMLGQYHPDVDPHWLARNLLIEGVQ